MAENMGQSRDSSDSKVCLAWDMVDRLVRHLEENALAKEGTSDVETGLENILGVQEVVGSPKAFHLAERKT